MSTRRPIVGGNWKMNTRLESGAALAREVAGGCDSIQGVEAMVFPPLPYLLAVSSVLRDRGSKVRLGAQNVWHEADGAFTGEVSVGMLAECGVEAVLCGHSERRHVLKEIDQLVNAKMLAVLEAGMSAVLCIGETLGQREAGETDAVNARQLRAGLLGVEKDKLARVVVAYEPVWAIGTGKTATPEDAQSAHAAIRGVLRELYDDQAADAMRIQYGGSCKPGNAAELFAQPDIDGGLIGGASLKSEDFLAIVRAASASS